MDTLTHDLLTALRQFPIYDPHSHIDPFRPVSQSLDDILGYHYYTELAHSAGMSQQPLSAQVPPRERVRAIAAHLERYDNTAQYAWFVHIAREFLGFTGDHLSPAEVETLFDTAQRVFAQPDWEAQVWRKTQLEKIFLTNEFDDPLTGFDTSKYVPCLRTDTLVFRLQEAEVRQRLARVAGVEVGDRSTLRRALHALFVHFKQHGAKACAISLPPSFTPLPTSDWLLPTTVFWTLAEMCREHGLPFDLMIGVNRRVYRQGVFQGQDLFDQRVSLVQYAELFNEFPQVTFPISVLSSGQNQELVSHAWIFPNVVTNGHWWYSNIPAYIRSDLTARLQAVPKIKQIGYYSDAYKLEFVLPKFDMYRVVLAEVLADEFVRPRRLSETAAVELGRLLLRDNARRLFEG